MVSCWRSDRHTAAGYGRVPTNKLPPFGSRLAPSKKADIYTGENQPIYFKAGFPLLVDMEN